MKSRNLMLLTGLAVLLVILAALSTRRERPQTISKAGTLIWPDFPVNDIARIEIASPEGTAVLARVNEVWVAPNRYDYPADFSKVRDLLLKMRDLKIGEVRRLSEAQRKALKLMPPEGVAEDERSQAGTIVRFYDAGSHRVASLLIGESRERSSPGSPFGGYPDGKFVSPDEGHTIYVVADSLYEVARQTRDWLDAEIVNIPSSEILDVRIRPAEGSEVHLTREKAGDPFRLADLSETEELDTSKLYSIESALSYLRMEDIVDPATSEEALGFQTGVVYTAITVTGLVYTVRVAGFPESSPNRYARFEVALRPDFTLPTDPTATNETEEARAKRMQEERTRRELEARRRHDRLSRWTYVIPSYKAEGMTRTRAELVKRKSELQETAEPPKTTPEAEETPRETTGKSAETEAASPPGQTPSPSAAPETPPPTAPVKAADAASSEPKF